MKQDTHKIEAFFGHVKLDSWFELRGERVVGMGRATYVNRDGGVEKVVTDPTGIELEMV